MIPFSMLNKCAQGSPPIFIWLPINKLFMQIGRLALTFERVNLFWYTLSEMKGNDVYFMNLK